MSDRGLFLAIAIRALVFAPTRQSGFSQARYHGLSLGSMARCSCTCTDYMQVSGTPG